MQAIRNILAPHPVFWFILSIPALAPLIGFAMGTTDAHHVVYGTGEWGARWLLIALIVGPLHVIFGPQGWTRWLVARRRALGLAAFIYGVLHLIFYVIDVQTLEAVLETLPQPGIWTGWVALFLMLPLALTSFDAAVRAMKAAWKRLHLLAYPAFAFVMAHWAIVGDLGALIWVVPVLVLQIWGYTKRRRKNATAIA